MEGTIGWWHSRTEHGGPDLWILSEIPGDVLYLCDRETAIEIRKTNRILQELDSEIKAVPMPSVLYWSQAPHRPRKNKDSACWLYYLPPNWMPASGPLDEYHEL